ncbi:hypothetical protein THRCLA_21023, partial [Thraustotheca clavata]
VKSMRILVVLNAIAVAEAITQFTFTNKCSYTINLHAAYGQYLCDIAPGEVNACTQNIGLGVNGNFRHTASDEVNLIEYSTINNPGFNFVWYDFSNIPPMPGNCNSYEDCKRFTGKTGYNVPTQLTPNNIGQGTCNQLLDMSPDAPDAYLFPADDTKTHACPIDTTFTVTCSKCGDFPDCATRTVSNQWCCLNNAVSEVSWSSIAFSGGRSA